MKFHGYELLDADLTAFDGEGGAPAGNGDGGGQAAGTPAETQVVFGTQGAPEHATTQIDTATTESQNAQPPAQETRQQTREDRDKAFRDLINGEYKEQYAAETQKLVNRRFRETDALQKRVNSYQPLIDVLSQRYGVDGADPAKLAKAVEDDSALWADAAEKAGLTVEQYKGMQKLQRENQQLRAMQQRQQGEQQMNAQLQRWYADGEATKAKYPGFDFASEAQNPQFLSMLRAGVPVEHAYKVLHMDQLMQDAMTTASQQTEKAVTENIKARGSRPKENGSAGQAAFTTVKDDVSKLSDKDVLEVLKRVGNGEKISFSR